MYIYINNMFKKKQNSGVWFGDGVGDGSVMVLEVGMNKKWRILPR